MKFMKFKKLCKFVSLYKISKLRKRRESKLTKKQNIQMYNQIYFVAIIKFDGACVIVNAAAHKHKI